MDSDEAYTIKSPNTSLEDLKNYWLSSNRHQGSCTSDSQNLLITNIPNSFCKNESINSSENGRGSYWKKYNVNSYEAQI